MTFANQYLENRLKKHLLFINERIASGRPLKHRNVPYGFPVITHQEKELILNELSSVEMGPDHSMQVKYCEHPQSSFCME